MHEENVYTNCFVCRLESLNDLCANCPHWTAGIWAFVETFPEKKMIVTLAETNKTLLNWELREEEMLAGEWGVEEESKC